MKEKLPLIVLLFGMALYISTTPTPVLAKTKFVTIATGGITHVYYQAGGAIARIINRKYKQYRIRCMVETSYGSQFNINAIMAGDMDFSVVQSVSQYQAITGQGEWKHKGPQKKLRAVFSIYSEPITLVAAVDANITTMSDLKGKKISIGNIGSNQRQFSIHALTTADINSWRDIQTEEVRLSETPSLLQSYRIDAFFYTGAHPNSFIKESTTGKRRVRFIPILKVEKLLAQYPYYVKTFIPVHYYPGAVKDQNVDTIGIMATFVTSDNVPEHIVYAITKEVFENLENFKKLHPAFQAMTQKSMLEGLSAPIHLGAMRYYKEAGLK